MIKIWRQRPPPPKPELPPEIRLAPTHSPYGHKKTRVRLHGIGGPGRDRYKLKEMVLGETRFVRCGKFEISDQQRSLYGTARCHKVRLTTKAFHDEGNDVHGVHYTLVGER